MPSFHSVLFTVLLLSELRSHMVTVAVPATKFGDGATEQDALGSFLGDEPMTEHGAVSSDYRRSHMLDNIRDDVGSPKIIIVSDTRLKGHSARGLNPAFPQAFPQLADPNVGHTPAEYTLKVDRRDTDLDILRCMVGRVYRPCWQI